MKTIHHDPHTTQLLKTPPNSFSQTSAAMQQQNRHRGYLQL